MLLSGLCRSSLATIPWQPTIMHVVVIMVEVVIGFELWDTLVMLLIIQ